MEKRISGRIAMIVASFAVAFSLLMGIIPGTINSAQAANQVSMTSKIVKIEAGDGHVLALMDDGTAWSWGRNDYGQLGLGNSKNTGTPTMISSLTDIIDIAAGQYFSLALKSDGTVYSWGRNNYYQLGLNNTSNKSIPTKITTISTIIQIGTGVDHALALTSGGKIYSWGRNSYGQLGMGKVNYTDKKVPTLISGISNAKKIQVGGYHNFALVNNGYAYVWGSNDYNQLNFDPDDDYYYDEYYWEIDFYYFDIFDEDTYIYFDTAPYPLKSEYSLFTNNQLPVSAGKNHSIEIYSNKVYTYGDNSYGQLGNGKTKQIWTEFELTSIASPKSTAVGDDHSLVLTGAGKVYAWGRNDKGQVGNGATASAVSTPNLTSLSNISKVFAGGGCSFAIDSSGELWAWGDNAYNQVSTTSAATITSPTKYTGFPLINTSSYDMDGVTYAVSQAVIGGETKLVMVMSDFEAQTDDGKAITYTPVMKINGAAESAMPQVNNLTGVIYDLSGVSSYSYGVAFELTAVIAGADGHDSERFDLETPLTYTYSWGSVLTSSSDSGAKPLSLTTGGLAISGISIPAPSNHSEFTATASITSSVSSYNKAFNLTTSNNSGGDVVVIAAPVTAQLGDSFSGSVQYHVGGVASKPAVGFTSGVTVKFGTADEISDLSSLSLTLDGANSRLLIPGLGTAIGGSIPSGYSINIALFNGSTRIGGDGAVYPVALTADGSDGIVSIQSLSGVSLGDSISGRLILNIPGVSPIEANLDGEIEIAFGSIDSLDDFESLGLAFSSDGDELLIPGLSAAIGGSIPADHSIKVQFKRNGGIIGVFDVNENGVIDVDSLGDLDLGDIISGVLQLHIPGLGAVQTELSGTVTIAFGELASANAIKNLDITIIDGKLHVTQLDATVGALASGYFVNADVYRSATKLTASPAAFASGTLVFGSAEAASPIKIGDSLTLRYFLNAPLFRVGITSSKSAAVSFGGVTSVSQLEELSIILTSGSIPAVQGLAELIGSQITAQQGYSVSAQLFTESGQMLMPLGSYPVSLLTGEIGDEEFDIAEGRLQTQLTFVTPLVLGDSTAENLVMDPVEYPPPSAGLGIVKAVQGYLEQSAHELFLMEDGTVWALGDNSAGAADFNSQASVITKPIKIAGVENIADIAASNNASFVLKSDGTVWYWGYPHWNSSATAPVTLTQLTGITGVKAISAGAYHLLMLKEDGTVYVLGNLSVVDSAFSRGQLGLGTTKTASAPTRITSLSGISQIEASRLSSFAIASNGNVYAWGNNVYGGLGIGSSSSSKTTPTVASGFQGAVKISATYDHTLALMSNGTIKASGDNIYGSLGIGNNSDKTSPVTVSGITGAVDVQAGGYHSAVLLDNGNVLCFGYNYEGQVGQGTNNEYYTTPKTVAVSNIGRLFAMPYKTYAVSGAGEIYHWGGGIKSPELFTGFPEVYPLGKAVEMPEKGAHDIVKISAGSQHTLMLLGDGSVWGWGRNNYYQLGMTGTSDRSAPVKISSLSNIVDIAAGENHSLALTADGAVYVWGRNNYGQLGRGNTTTAMTPTKLTTITGVKQIRAGASHSLFLKTDGKVYAAGRNNLNQLGTGSTASTSTSPALLSLTGITDIFTNSSASHSFALASDGTVYAWGNADSGQLGMTASGSTPVKIDGLTGAVDIALGESHTIALMRDGTVRTFGGNASGQLGDGGSESRSYPYRPAEIKNAIGVAAGKNHSLVLLKNGNTYTFGANATGQLGVGGTKSSGTPAYAVIAGSQEIFAGYGRSYSIKQGGGLWAWGENDYYQTKQTGKGTSTLLPALYDYAPDMIGDTYQTAREISLTSEGFEFTSAVNSAADIDWLKIVCVETGFYKFNISTSATAAAFEGDAQTELSYYSPVMLSEGENIYIKLSHPGSGDVLPYTVSAVLFADPDEHLGGSALTLDIPETGSFTADSDYAWYSFTPNENMEIILSIDCEKKLSYTIYSENLTKLTAGTRGQHSLSANKTYYIRISYHVAIADELAYTITVRKADAAVLALGTPVSGALTLNDSQLWFSFTPSANMDAFITMMGDTGVKTAVYDSAYALQSKKSGVYNLKAGEKYYIKVYHSQASLSEPLAFDLTVSDEPGLLASGLYYTAAMHVPASGAAAGDEFTLSYDTLKLQLLDMNAQTAQADMPSSGVIAGTKAAVVSHNTSTGKLTLKTNEAIAASDDSQQRLLVIVKFKKLVDETPEVHLE